jgi:hypothetical protein
LKNQIKINSIYQIILAHFELFIINLEGLDPVFVASLDPVIITRPAPAILS